MNEVSSLVNQLQQGDTQSLAKAITIVENDLKIPTRRKPLCRRSLDHPISPQIENSR